MEDMYFSGGELDDLSDAIQRLNASIARTAQQLPSQTIDLEALRDLEEDSDNLFGLVKDIRRGIRLRASAIQSLEKQRCCPAAIRIPCVCMRAILCNVHGEKHYGTHE